MDRLRLSTTAVLVCSGFTAAACGAAPDDASTTTATAGDGVPRWEFDATWPRLPLPNEQILGEVGGIDVDSQGHIWVIQRPWTVSGRELGAVTGEAACCRPAPPVIEFTPEGDVVQAWPQLRTFQATEETPVGQGNRVSAGGEELWEAMDGEGYGEWGRREHTVLVDHNDFVWVTLDNSHVIYKFTRAGQHVLTIGEAGRTSGSNHTSHLGRPAGLAMDPETNELFVADGYTNKRVIVFGGETGEYLRHWGAYGNRPEDVQLQYDPDGEPPQQFVGPVHGIALARDGLLYVSDRRANRIQVFERDGTYVDEVFISPETRDLGTAYGVALSKDPDQQWVFVNDGSNNTIWVLRRSDLEVIGSVGSYGRNGGQFRSAHSMVVDQDNNLYIGETRGRRVQKYAYLGLGRP